MSHLHSKGNSFPVLMDKSVSSVPNPILVEVVFGAPSKHCQGAGICNLIAINHVRAQWKCPSARALLRTTQKGAICLSFDRNELSTAILERFFKGELFQVEEVFPLPNHLCSLLNISPYTIAPGRYSLKVSERFIEILF
jgi:hypothetical protein